MPINLWNNHGYCNRLSTLPYVQSVTLPVTGNQTCTFVFCYQAFIMFLPHLPRQKLVCFINNLNILVKNYSSFLVILHCL